MSAGSGYYDAEGVWTYGENDSIALFSDTLNRATQSISVQFTLDRNRIGTLEQYAAISPNKILNSAFEIWQRGTSFTNPASGAYTADRWCVTWNGTGATRTVSLQTFTPGAPVATGLEYQYFIRSQSTVAGSGMTTNQLAQRIEDVRSIAGQTITVSFYAKAAATTNVSISWDKNYGTSGSATEYGLHANNHTLTTSWQRYSSTYTVASLTGKTIGANSYAQLNFNLPQNATYTVDLWGVQVEASGAATVYRRNTTNLANEVAACQRYYYRLVTPVGYGTFGSGVARTTTGIYVPIRIPATMRSTVAFIETTGTAANYMCIGGANVVCNAVPTVNTNGRDVIELLFPTASGLTVGQAYLAANNNLADTYIGFSAEL